MNKVEFGISQLHFAPWIEDDQGNVTIGTPYHQKGAISYTPEQNSNKSSLDADNIEYWAEYTDGSVDGDLNVARFDDEFKTTYLGYKRSKDGGIGKVKGAKSQKACVMFQIEGDEEARRVIFYNCTLGAIKRGYNTIKQDGKEVDTESMTISCSGDNTSGFWTNSFYPGDDGYDDLFTSPSVPEVEEESE